MKRSLFRFFVAAALTALPCFAVEAWACTCRALPSPYQAYHEAAAVFVGKVVGSRDIPYDENIKDPEENVYDRYFRFAVEETFKGTKAAEIDINVGRVDSSCYQGYTVGQTYLVYAYPHDRRFNLSESYYGRAWRKPDATYFSGACTRTENLKSARDDVYHLRALLRGQREPRLYGSVFRLDDDPDRPGESRVTYLEGIRISVEGAKGRFETVTDRNGLYSFARLPAGEYKVRPALPPQYMNYFFSEEKVTVGGRGYGAFAEFMTGWNNQVEGRVLDAEGRPVERAVVRLLPADRAADPMPPMYENISDHLGREGMYRIYGKTPGRYVLAVEVYAPFASGPEIVRTYHPQSAAPERAEVVNLGETDRLSIDVKLPPGRVVREIEGVLVWSDGTPVTGDGYVFLEKLETDEDSNNVRYDLESVGKDGRFRIQAFEGAEYWLKGEVGTLGLKLGGTPVRLWERGVHELKAKPVKVRPSTGGAPVRMVIPLPEGFTSARQQGG